MITVYEKQAHCTNCREVKRNLNSYGLHFRTRFIDDEILEYAKEKGFKAAPIVIDDEHPELNFCGADLSTLWKMIEKNGGKK